MEHSDERQFYLDAIKNLHCSKINGKLVVAKPIFLLSIIQGIEEKVLQHNRFVWNREDPQYVSLSRIYKEVFSGYLPNNIPTQMCKPFVHLCTDKVWILIRKTQSILPDHSYGTFLKNDVEYAKLPDVLWNMLNCTSERDHIKEIILNTYIRNC